MTDPQASLKQALLTERAGYVRRGLTKRVAAVDDALRALGVTQIETASVAPQVETAARKKPLKRTKG